MLDSAELAARLELNHLQADQGEQIAVDRDDREVQVKGIVETSARKQEIARALGKIPLVQVELLSIAELQQQPVDNTTTQSVSMQSVDVAASPLERYLLAAHLRRPGACCPARDRAHPARFRAADQAKCRSSRRACNIVSP